MLIRIYGKTIDQFTELDHKTCRRMKDVGAIVSLLDSCEKKQKIGSKRRRLRHKIFIAKSYEGTNKKYVGWAIMIEDLKKGKKAKDYEFMVYVKHAYRRNGIGKKLFKKSKEFFNLRNDQIRVYKTNNLNTKFYDNLMPL